ncbi:MAG: pyridoxal-dependent decarboxylase, partial [Actinomycetota bacterium]
IAPGITEVQHPMHFGWFPSNASLASVLGDLASSGIGSLGISWESSPALTEVEEVVCDWMRQLTGLSDAWSGTIQDTASTACIVALLTARERATAHGQATGGLPAAERPPVVYTTSQAHSSVRKAALLAGYGADNLRVVDHDRAYAMDPAALAAAMASDVADGRQPAAVVASVGTTGTTAMDPVAAIVEAAAAHQAWVHVDAAMAGTAMLVPECRPLWDGVEGADSVTWNPHKWMGTILDTSLYYVRDVEHLVRVMSTNPSYLRSNHDGEVTQYRDWGLPLGRRFRSLKLLFHLHLDGIEAIQDRIRRDLTNARWLADQVGAADGWEVVAPVPLQTVCVRHRPAGDLTGEDLDRHTLAWVDEINRSGDAYLTPSILDDRWMVRVSVGVESTERHHVEQLWAKMQDAADRSAASVGVAT